MPVIEAVGLRRSYRTGAGFLRRRPLVVEAVKGVELRGRRGPAVRAAQAPTGAGKTTTIKMLTTLLVPSEGRPGSSVDDVVADARRVRASNRLCVRRRPWALRAPQRPRQPALLRRAVRRWPRAQRRRIDDSAGPGRARRPGARAGRRLLARHAPAAAHRQRAACTTRRWCSSRPVYGDRLPADPHLHLRLRPLHPLRHVRGPAMPRSPTPPPQRARQAAGRRRRPGRRRGPRGLHRPRKPDRRQKKSPASAVSSSARRGPSPSTPGWSSAPTAATPWSPEPCSPSTATSSRKLLVGYYSYWSGLPMDGRFETYIRPDRGFAAWPTNNDLTVVIGGWPSAEFHANKHDIEATYHKMLDLAPAFADRVAAARRETRYVGTAVPNFFRKPYGPGWALVGDAGYNKDFITAQGMHDAFRDAELCATALDETFTAASAFDDRDGRLPGHPRHPGPPHVRAHHPARHPPAPTTRPPATARGHPRQPERDGRLRPQSWPASPPPPTSSPSRTSSASWHSAYPDGPDRKVAVPCATPSSPAWGRWSPAAPPASAWPPPACWPPAAPGWPAWTWPRLPWRPRWSRSAPTWATTPRSARRSARPPSGWAGSTSWSTTPASAPPAPSRPTPTTSGTRCSTSTSSASSG